VLKEFTDQTSIRFYFNSNNLGFVRNFEKAISLCEGEYIALCDHDNILVYANSEIIDKSGKTLNKQLSSIRNFVNGSDPIPFIFHNCIPGHTMMFHRRLISYILPFPFELKFHDWWIAFVAASVGKILYIDECLVSYRQHETTNTDILKARKVKIKEKDKSLKLEKITKDIIDKISIFRDFKHLKPKDKEVLSLMAEGYQLRIGAYFSPKLFSLLFKYRNHIYYIPKYSPAKKLLYVVKESWGTKTKKLFYKVKELF
jgi:glycosyltransferase involved in cell wall biosynthesis